MSTETLRGMLLWSAVINYVMLGFWGLLTLRARDLMHRAARWWGLPVETFAAVNYVGILFYKIGIFLFNLVPYIALRIAG